MMMKYFRFLYGGTGGVFTHFGEIRDQKTKECFRFLYLRGMDRHAALAKAGRRLFLCPKSLDLAVLSDLDGDSAQEIREGLSGVSVDTLICSANTHFAIPEVLPNVKKVVRLKSGLGREEGRVGGEEEKDRIFDCFQKEAAGWKLILWPCENGSLTLLHGLAEGSLEEKEAQDIANQAYPYSDCVMSVKIVNEENRCRKEMEPDGYGCAVGCSLHQDYDMCNYQRGGKTPYVTGTWILPVCCGGTEWETAVQELKKGFLDIRFFCLPGDMDSGRQREVSEEIPGEASHKRYFIGMDGGLPDALIGAVAKSSMYHTPLIPGPGEALCCSGFLKYTGEA